MIITGLYIVKNEEKEIRRSIESIRGICDEIVVVDTGSEDNTVEVVESLGAKVFHFDWVNDFSKARNYALEKAKGDLIIFIDADEWFPEPLNQDDRKYLEDLVRQDYRVFAILRSNISDNALSEPVYNTRMFQGKKGLYYIGSIHESISSTEKSVFLPERFLLYHSGYEGVLAREKSERNIKLLYNQFEQETAPFRRMGMCFYLARENALLGNVHESLKYVDVFFEMWNKGKKSDRPLNVGICVYDLVARIYAELGEYNAANELYSKVCTDFVRDFPGHPAAYYALANYYYVRHRNYPGALKAIEKVEETFEKYRIEDYPHDYVGATQPRANALMIKGNIMYDRGEKDKAFDCYASILRSVKPSSGFLRRLLSLIKNQPAEDVIAFVSAIPMEVTVDYIELLLSQVLYFPSLKDVYMYFAVQHLKMTRQQSDVSAIAAIISENSTDLAVEIANAMYTDDPMTAGKLFILAAIFSDDPGIRKTYGNTAYVEKILDSYFKGESPERLSGDDLALISSVFPIVLFLDNEEATRKFVKIISNFKFIFAFMIMNYCNNSGEYDKLLPLIDIDPDELTTENRAAFFRQMGRAFISLQDYESAMSYLKEAFMLSPSDLKTYKELGTLASVCPELAAEIHTLVSSFRLATGKNNEQVQGLAAISSVFEDRDGSN